MNLKEFFETTALFDENKYEVLQDFSDVDELDEEEIVCKSFKTLAESLYTEYVCFTWGQIFNSMGIIILGKDKAIKFKKLYTQFNKTEDEENELIKLKNEILDVIFENYENALLVNNGILLSYADGIVDFESDSSDEFLSWKYSNWNDSNANDFTVSEEYKSTLINESHMANFYDIED